MKNSLKVEHSEVHVHLDGKREYEKGEIVQVYPLRI